MTQTAAPETIPVREGHRFDEVALDAYLREHVAGYRGPLEVRQFAGGQSNPTYLLRAGSERWVMRKKPPGKLLPSAHAVDREYRVIRALGETDVPVARAVALCDDAQVIGTAFYVMEYVEGRIFRAPTLPDLEPAERSAIYDAMNDVLARLHRVDVEAVGLGDFGRPGNYFARQIARWSKQYAMSQTGDPIASMDALLEWLPANLPPGDETTLVHGDYRLENMIFHPSEPRVLAVLDWELSTLGHPLADLAYNCIGYHGATADGTSLAGIDLERSGIPTEQEYVAAYCRRVGRTSVEGWNFCIAFSLFRLAAIAQGIAARAQQGNAASATARSIGAQARRLADHAWEIARRRD